MYLWVVWVVWVKRQIYRLTELNREYQNRPTKYGQLISGKCAKAIKWSENNISINEVKTIRYLYEEKRPSIETSHHKQT